MSKTVAILGASTDRNKFGNKAVRAFIQQGFDVYPVNAKEPVVEGLTAYKSVLDIPVKLEMISVYLPPAITLKTLPEIAKKGCRELWLNPGTESDEIIEEATRLKLNVVTACSIVGIGVSPSSL